MCLPVFVLSILHVAQCRCRLDMLSCSSICEALPWHMSHRSHAGKSCC